MAKITLQLIGDINKFLRNEPNNPLQPKYMAVVTAEDLALYFRYTKGRRRGKHTFKPEVSSLIKIDPEIQRGLTTTGELRQEDSKIEEISKALMGKSSESEKIFLGTLVWNVRDENDETFNVRIMLRTDEGLPPEYTLVINTDAIYLTDSVHRHIGICEALRKHKEDASSSCFNPKMEFPVEIYNLDKRFEKMLFRELNSKQKKITAAKQQEVDNTTPLGRLKEAIRSFDQANEGFFVENIEVNSNQNEQHTLMTMSVFVASIKEMFGKNLIDESAKNDGLRDSLAEYFVKSFYALRDTIKVTCTIHGREVDVSPFSNLYDEFIRPVEDAFADEDDEERIEAKLKDARTKASVQNQAIREQDKLNCNSFIKGISYALGRVRQMTSPQEFIDLLQSRLISALNGKYFQAVNPRMTQTMPTGHSIATFKEDRITLNVQVQTHTINEIKSLFRDELFLSFKREMSIEVPSSVTSFILNDKVASSEVVVLKRGDQTHFTVCVEFDVGAQVMPVEIDCLLRIKPDLPNCPWVRSIQRLGDPLSADECRKVAGYTHSFYKDGIARYQAKFLVSLPQFIEITSDPFNIMCTVSLLDEVGDETQIKGIMTCRGE